jgi:hypothetical protein
MYQFTNLQTPDPDIEPHKKVLDAIGGPAMALALNLRPVSGYGIVMPVGIKDAEYTRADLERLRRQTGP